jgi:hypothetical protein
MPTSDNYRPTKKDEDFILGKFVAVYTKNGPPLTEAEDEFFKLVSEAFRIGTPRRAATIGEARASLQAQIDARHTQGFAASPIGSGFLYDKEAYFGHGASYLEKNLTPAHRARILQDYEDHATT